MRIFILTLMLLFFALSLFGGLRTGRDATGRWKPTIGTAYFTQLTGMPPLYYPAELFTLDLFETDFATIEKLRKLKRKVFCYISMGTVESYRPDAKNFPNETIGKILQDWPDERYIDIRRIDLLAPVLQKRIDLCKEKGFDGIETDNIDAYQADSGFPITENEQIAFNVWLADEAHKRGLFIGMKNAHSLVTQLVYKYDFAVTEECAVYNECAAFLPFIENEKPVFEIEYTDTPVLSEVERPIDWDAACAYAKQNKFTLVMKHRELDAWQKTCE